jgi:hypothetical protein
MTHDDRLRKAGLPSLETLTRRIVRVWDKATDSDLEAGSRWYPEAFGLAADMAAGTDYTVDQAAAVISHLSPRNKWERNVLAASMLVREGTILPGIMGREAAKAQSVLSDGWDEIVESFGGPKTRRFYLNIMGDRESVTVDVWACRVASVDENLLSRVGVYEALEAAYQRAARRVGVDPSTMQATTWVVAREGRA